MMYASEKQDLEQHQCYYPPTSVLYIPISKKEIVNTFHHLEKDQVINKKFWQKIF